LTTYAYDALGRTTQVTHPDNSTVLTTYTGRATEVQDEGNGTQRVTRISQSDGLGRLLSLCEVAPGPFVGANGASTSSLIGSSGAPVACGQDIAGTGFLTTYQYDTLSNLLQVNQSGNASRTFTYDSLSRLLTTSNPESGAISYAYDANGNLSTKTSPLPNQTGSATVITTYNYDALNRLTTRSYNDGSTPTASYTFDSPGCGTSYLNTVGRRSYAAVPGWSYCYGYDPMGRVTDIDLVTPQSQYHYLDDAYNLLGALTTETAGYGFAYYGYNTAGRLTSVTSSYSDSQNPSSVMSSAHYNAFGSLTSDMLGDNEAETYAYVPKMTRLQSYTSKLNSTTNYNFNITSFAPNGDVLAATDTANGNWTYTHDGFNRLVGANQNSGQAVYNYVYDRFGNRWQQNGPHTFLATFTGNNQSNPQNNNRMDGYSYDAAGNLLNDGTHNYKYDAENRLIQVDAGGTATYVYDADGRRIQKASTMGSNSDPTGTWIYFYDLAGRWVQEFTSPNNTFWRGNIYAGGRHLATVGYGSTKFSHSDWLGTERVRTTYQGAVCEWIASLPFGDGQTITFPPYNDCGHPSPFNFTGKERDSESGLDNFGARYDSSQLGRFMSPDPSGLLAQKPTYPQSWNLYAYAMNNPLIFIDPTGLDCVYANDAGNGVESIDHNSNSGECGQNGGSWAPGYADENWAHFNNSTGMFQVGSINGAGNSATVDYTMFEAGAQTQFNGDESSCLSGCAGFSLANANWLQSMLVGRSRIGGLDGMISFMVNRENPLSPGGLMRLAAGPGLSPNAPDNWAGKGGMGPPQNRSDWAAMVHDYNFDANLINIGSYFNPNLSLATSKALITSNNTLLRNVGGIQRAKMGLFFGPLNAFQWYTNSWK
jgi:RHS repeat-associated protein